MNLNDLRELNQAITGDGLALSERASKMCDVLTELADSSYDKFSPLASILSCWVSGVNVIEKSEIAELDQLLDQSSDNSITISTSTLKGITIRRQKYVNPLQPDLYMNTIYYSNDFYNNLLSYTSKVEDNEIVDYTCNIHLPTKFSDGSSFNLNPSDLVTNLSQGVSLSRVYADICQCIKNHCDVDPSILVSQVQTIISDKVELFGGMRANLISAAGQGANTLLGFITQVISNTNQLLTDASSSGEYPDYSTTFEVSAFSWGIVAGTLTSLAQIAGAIMIALGGVIRVIGAVLSAVVNVVSNAFNNIVAAETQTAFFVSTPFGAPCFNFVLDEYDKVDPNLVAAIQAIGSKAFTINSPKYPALIVGYVIDDVTVHCQELPSVNFSFSNAAFYDDVHRKIFIGANRFITLSPVRQTSTQTGDTVGIIIKESLLDDNTFSAFVDSAYDPVSLQVASWLDQLKDFANSNIRDTNANLYLERLLCSMILWFLFKNKSIIPTILNAAGVSYQYFGVPLFGTTTNPRSGSLLGQQLDMLARIGFVYATGMGLHYDGSHGDVNFSGVQDDALLNIKKFFNNLTWRNYTQANEYGDFEYQLFDNSFNSTIYQLPGGVNQLSNLYSPLLYKGDTLSGYNISTSIILGTDNTNLTDVINNNCSVSVPRNLVSGIFFGILVDVLLIAMIAVTAVGIARLSIKIKDRVLRSQANTEAAWYKYQDKVKEGASQAAQDAAWKAYKRLRFKSNILSAFTGMGNTTAALTSDGSFASDVLIPVYDRIVGNQNSVVNEEVTLATLLHKIIG